jgi:hypothetical protein
MEKTDIYNNKQFKIHCSKKDLNFKMLRSSNDDFVRIFYKKQNIIKVVINRLNDNKREKFIDELFPPCDISLYFSKAKKKQMTGEENLEAYNKEKIWISLSESLNEKSEFFMNKNFILDEKICPQEIKQGSLSNCYYLSSMASLAKEPELIVKLFPIINVDLIEELILKGKNPLDSEFRDSLFIEYDNYSESKSK